MSNLIRKFRRANMDITPAQQRRLDAIRVAKRVNAFTHFAGIVRQAKEASLANLAAWNDADSMKLFDLSDVQAEPVTRNPPSLMPEFKEGVFQGCKADVASWTIPRQEGAA